MAKAPSTFSDVTVLRYKKGEQIIKQGDYGISIYIILNGNVEVSRESEGGDVVLATLGPGDIIGEMIFLNKGVEVRSASARALQDSELEVWHPDDLGKKYEEIAPVLKAMINQVLKRLLRMNKLRDKLVPKIQGQRETKAERGRAKPSHLLVLGHHVFDGFVKAVQGELIHGENLSNDPDGAGVRPFKLELRIQPDGMTEGLCNKLEPLVAWLS